MQVSGVRLEPLSAEHVAGLDAIAMDPDVQRNTYVPSPPPPDFGKSWLERYEQGREDGTREGFAIVDAEDGSFLGIAVAVRIDEEANEAELGYILAPAAGGRGAATEALRQLTEWGFARGLQRLELRGDADNEASRRVAERCGYTLEGILRSIYFKEGRRSDMFIYSRLPGDDQY
jgi:RimJ/RimL family protein N-acetyltransferase